MFFTDIDVERFVSREDLHRYPKPCRIIEKLEFDYDEGFRNVLKEKDRPCTSTASRRFRIQIYFGDTNFKEIKHVREINTEGLAGEISGYIGFILGYSILQLPNLLLLVKELIGNIIGLAAFDDLSKKKLKARNNEVRSVRR